MLCKRSAVYWLSYISMATRPFTIIEEGYYSAIEQKIIVMVSIFSIWSACINNTAHIDEYTHPFLWGTSNSKLWESNFTYQYSCITDSIWGKLLWQGKFRRSLNTSFCFFRSQQNTTRLPHVDIGFKGVNVSSCIECWYDSKVLKVNVTLYQGIIWRWAQYLYQS